MTEENHLIDLIRFLWKKRRLIIIWTGSIAILSIVVSLLLPNYYKSTTTFYASAQSLANPESIFGSQEGQMFFFGSDSDVDRLLSIGRSNELATYIIDKYNLIEHYEIDTTKLKGKERLMIKFRGMLDVIKNKYDAVELSFEDEDRSLVDDVANDCRDKINEIAKRVMKENQLRMIRACEKNIVENELKLAIVEDSIISITRKYGIVDAESQGEQISNLLVSTEAGISEYSAKYDYLKKNASSKLNDTLDLIKAELEGLRNKKSKLINDDLSDFSKGSGRMIALQQLQSQMSKRIGYDTDRLQQLNSAYESDISALVTLEAASEPYVKSRPKRTIIVLAATFGGFIFSVLLLILLKNIRELQLLQN
jgi:uncharacterized protein involved in exopolysaccharide biosynthesis